MASNNRSSLAASLQNKLNRLTSSPSGLVRVPKHLRRLDEDGYTPQLVSIGPFHHGEPGLIDFEEEKLRCLRAFLSWSQQTLKTLIDRVIKGNEDRLKRFYAPGTYGNFDEDSFLEIILADATFIVAVMLGYYEGNEFRAGNECIFRRTYTELHVRRDLALLENQIPLFILVDLYELIKASRRSRVLNGSFCKLAIRFLKFITISPTEIPDDYMMMGSSTEEETEVRHLVDLLRRYHRPSQSRLNPWGNESSRIAFHSLTELYECGVKLKLSTSKDALDIRYINGTLEIPKIDTSPERMTTLENMVSFEQCYCNRERYVTDYVNLMAKLVRSPNDVELLIRHGVLDGWLNQVICKFFYDLGRESSFSINLFYYRRLCEDLDKYCKVPWHPWRATLRHESSKNPFAAASACLSFLTALLELLDKRERWDKTFTTFGSWGPPLILSFLFLAYFLKRYHSFKNPFVALSLCLHLLLAFLVLIDKRDNQGTIFTTICCGLAVIAFFYA